MTRFNWHIRKNLSLAIPVMIGQLGQIMVGFADNIMVGHVGKVPLAAASLANSIYITFLVFGIGLSYVISPQTAKADGENDHAQLKSILKHALLVCGSAGIVLSMMVVSGSYLLPYLNQPEDVVVIAIPYLQVIGLSLVPLMIFQAMRQFLEGLARTRGPMLIIIITNILNVIFNYLLIFGKLGFPELGLLGAGISTLFARCVMCIIIYAYLFHGGRNSVYTLGFKFRKFSRSMINKLLRLGIPMGMQFTFEVTTFSFAAIMVGWLGATQLAAHQIAINLASITYMAATGISAAATIRVGNQLGRKDLKTMQMASFTCLFLVTIFMTICALAFILLRHFLPTMYIEDLEVIRLASSLLVIAALFQLSDGIQVVGLGSLRGISDVKIPTIITLISYWVIAIPAAYILAFQFKMGAVGVWWGLLIGLTIAAIWLNLRFKKVSQIMLGT